MTLSWVVVVQHFGAGVPRQGHDIDKDERLPRRLRCEDYDSRRLDVFALIKQTMAEQALSQNALLVLPQTLLSETEAFLNSVSLWTKYWSA